jgi:predicted Abi (CAAX) family protease
VNFKHLPQDRGKRREAISSIRRMLDARYRAMILPSLACGLLFFAILLRGGPETGVEWSAVVGLIVLIWMVVYVGGVFFAGAPKR